jgi:uncharacterized membrane protein YccC
MKSFKEIAGVSPFQFCEYNVKCFVGVTIGYLVYREFPEQSGLWMLLSILLSITHDNNSTVAFDRMKGNLVGSAVGLFAFFLRNPPNLLTICIGVAMTIAICFRLRLIGATRTALVAFIIVVLYEEAHQGWEGAIYRMTSVVVGCLIGLIINFTFRKLAMMLTRSNGAAAVGAAENAGVRDGGE